MSRTGLVAVAQMVIESYGLLCVPIKRHKNRQVTIPLPSMYSILTYIYQILPLEPTKCR